MTVGGGGCDLLTGYRKIKKGVVHLVRNATARFWTEG